MQGCPDAGRVPRRPGHHQGRAGRDRRLLPEPRERSGLWSDRQQGRSRQCWLPVHLQPRHLLPAHPGQRRLPALLQPQPCDVGSLPCRPGCHGGRARRVILYPFMPGASAMRPRFSCEEHGKHGKNTPGIDIGRCSCYTMINR